MSQSRYVDDRRVWFEGTELHIGEASNRTDQPILDIAVAGGYVCVLLDPAGYGPDDPSYERNVMGYDLRARAMWRIAPSQGGYTEHGRRYRSPFVRLASAHGGCFFEVSEALDLDHDVVPRTGILFNMRPTPGRAT
ncbi:MAG: hypothetical protein ACKVSF_11170 [Alphaproteobacteria bacterium]